MGKSNKPAQTPKDREREYAALYRSVGLSSEEEVDSNESDSDDEAGSGLSSEEGPTTPKRGKGMTIAESPQQWWIQKKESDKYTTGPILVGTLCHGDVRLQCLNPLEYERHIPR